MAHVPRIQRRVSRRLVLAQLGGAGVGVLVLGACASDSSDDAASPAADTGSTVEPGSADLQWQHVPLGSVSAYVLLRGRDAAIVDTGGRGSAGDIIAGLDALGARPADVRHIVLTHSHGDHVGGLGGVLDAATSATVYAGAADVEAIESAMPLQSVEDGDEVFGMGVVATPGHTPGSISLFDTGTGLLVAGDAINGDNGSIVGPDARYTSDMDTALGSLDKLAALDAQIAAFGHGGAPITTDVAAQLRTLAAN